MGVTHATTVGPVGETQWNEEHDVSGLAADVHAHAESDVTSLVTDLAGKSSVGHAHVHGHAESEITNLAADLAGKASNTHNHDLAYEALDHTHPESEVTSLVTDLAGKAASGHNHDASYATVSHTHPGGSEAFPVGAVFIAVVNTNPGTLLGYGTWSAFGAGRMLVGLDSGQTEFDTVEEVGGSKTHTHAGHSNHAVTQPSAHSDHTSHTHQYTQVPNHVHVQNLPSSQTGGQASGTRDTSTNGSVADALSTANPTGGVATGTTVGPDAALAHSAHSGTAVDAHSAHDSPSSLPPYIVVYMWKRTA